MSNDKQEKQRIRACFWCGEPFDKNEEFSKDKLPLIQSYVPCPKCKEIFDKGFHVIGVSHEPMIDGIFPISKDEDGDVLLYPTGAFFVADEDFIRSVITDDEEFLQNVLEKRVLMLPAETVDTRVEEINKNEKNVSVQGSEESVD